MKERPILFSAPMVRALLDGSKTQTRRAVAPEWQHFNEVCPMPESVEIEGGKSMVFPGRTPASFLFHNGIPIRDLEWQPVTCKFGQPGDRLWVRETWAHHPDYVDSACRAAMYRADRGAENDVGRWKPSIFMPRWASRIALEITGVRVERLQDISEADARLEGVLLYERDRAGPGAQDAAVSYRQGYAWLWESINATRAPWASNPWVWVLEFKRVAP